MKKVALVLAGVSSLILTSGAMGAIASTNAVLVTQGTSFAGHTTYDVFISFTGASGAGNTLLNTTQWNVTTQGSATFYNASPITDDPFGIVPDTGGLTPVSSAIPGYGNWAFDTNLSMDDALGSSAEPGTVITSTSITGGVFVTPPSPTAGADLMIQVAQITVSGTGPTVGIFSGQFLAVTPSAVAGQGVDTTIIHVTNAVPGPGALALLGVAGLVSRRRRA